MCCCGFPCLRKPSSFARWYSFASWVCRCTPTPCTAPSCAAAARKCAATTARCVVWAQRPRGPFWPHLSPPCGKSRARSGGCCARAFSTACAIWNPWARISGALWRAFCWPATAGRTAYVSSTRPGPTARPRRPGWPRGSRAFPLPLQDARATFIPKTASCVKNPPTPCSSAPTTTPMCAGCANSAPRSSRTKSTPSTTA